jgi:hypothetical protein
VSKELCGTLKGRLFAGPAGFEKGLQKPLPAPAPPFCPVFFLKKTKNAPFHGISLAVIYKTMDFLR